ncbi:MAG: DNA repair protein RadA [Parachlamydiales bacterium]
MAKVKSAWFCSECGHQQVKWSGQCPACEAWNTLQEETVVAAQSRFEARGPEPSKPIQLKEIAHLVTPRYTTGMGELDRMMGGGVVVGSLTLVGGEPGIGKSTLLLQLTQAFADKGLKVLYISAEESVQQTGERAGRLGVDTDNLYLLNETHFSLIQKQVEALRPEVVIVDSIQMIYKGEIPSAPGSVTQVRESAMEFMHLAKQRGIAIFLVGHVTKSGELAGPRVLEHLVDTVLYFEGDKQHHLRLMRGVKNRFGPTDEVAVFQMGSKGLEQVENPSELFIEERRSDLAGSVIVPTLEGSRPILVEIQALVTRTAYSTPSRRSIGLDQSRLALLLAVMEKRLSYPLTGHDVFVSVAGGIKVTEPSTDLGILLAVASSWLGTPIPSDTLVVGEVGLGGEVRTVRRVEARIKEGKRMGFTRFVLPKRSLKGLDREGTLLEGVDLVEEAIQALLPSK